MFYAHSTDDSSRSNWQTLQEHLETVADLSRQYGETFGAGKAAYFAGLLHDIGKYTVAFQARLTGAKERVDHSTAGAAIVLEMTNGDDQIIAELIAYAIAGHHAGLPDKQGESFSTLGERIRKFSVTSLDSCWKNEIVADASGLLPGFNWVLAARDDTQEVRDAKKARLAFQFAFLGRMIFSCLVDADFKDTEEFYNRIEGRRVDRKWSSLQGILPGLLTAFERHMAGLRNVNSPVNILRSNILDYVRSRAREKPSLFTLTVPTGGGKTLASLGFALDHAQANGHDRIIYVAPFTTIIDQTASLFRKILGNEVVLEHHSAIDVSETDKAVSENVDSQRSSKNKLKLAMEDWAAPIIVTTNVQLFESLFAAKTSQSRKLHNIARSVIILDEAQTLPRRLLIPAAWALRELAENYGCTIVLCTATQPALNENKFSGNRHPGLPLDGKELAPDIQELARKLERVRLVHAGEMSDTMLVEALLKEKQGLTIVNSRRHALALYQTAKGAGLKGLIHLTTRQYAVHRQKILKDIRHRLESNLPCVVIATSLVEAGIDLDFPKVWRSEAGLDQIAQAAGRCNREGKRPLEESIVTIFSAPEYPTPPEIKSLTGDLRRIMAKHEDLLSPAAIEDFFREVYWRVGREGLDSENIVDDFRFSARETNFAYRTVAKKFQMIESGMLPVIVNDIPEVQTIINKMAIERVSSGGIARELQSYIVQVPPKARQRLIDCGHVAFAERHLRQEQFAVLLTKSLYKADIGLVWEDVEYLGEEQWII